LTGDMGVNRRGFWAGAYRAVFNRRPGVRPRLGGAPPKKMRKSADVQKGERMSGRSRRAGENKLNTRNLAKTEI